MPDAACRCRASAADGDDIAFSLGVAVRPLRFGALLLASLLAGAVVSFAGLLGFVGLIVPHIARRPVGHDVRRLYPVCILGGALRAFLQSEIPLRCFGPEAVEATTSRCETLTVFRPGTEA